MARKMIRRHLSVCLVVVMLLTTLLPIGAYAADDSAVEDAAANYEETIVSESENISEEPADLESENIPVELEDQESELADDAPAVTEISDYATFLSCFKALEGYAQTYAEENAGEDANALIINYIRTGVERYPLPALGKWSAARRIPLLPLTFLSRTTQITHRLLR